jgi:hypothetical protein
MAGKAWTIYIWSVGRRQCVELFMSLLLFFLQWHKHIWNSLLSLGRILRRLWWGWACHLVAIKVVFDLGWFDFCCSVVVIVILMHCVWEEQIWPQCRVFSVRKHVICVLSLVIHIATYWFYQNRVQSFCRILEEPIILKCHPLQVFLYKT